MTTVSPFLRPHLIRGTVPEDVPARLEEMALLKDGWLDGQGQSLSGEGLHWFGQAFTSCYPGDLPRPYIYPTPEGGLQLEWTLGVHEVSLEIDLFSRSAHWHGLDLDTGEETTQSLHLAEPSGWSWIVAEVQRRLGGGA